MCPYCHRDDHTDLASCPTWTAARLVDPVPEPEPEPEEPDLHLGCD